MSNSSIWPMAGTLSDTNKRSQSELGSDGNEKVLYIPHSSGITGASPSYCLGLYRGYSLVRVGLTPLKQSVYFIASADVTWNKNEIRITVSSVFKKTF